MKAFKILLLIITVPLLSFTTLHKYYVSVTEIEYVESQKSVQIISRFFIDDFEKMLRQRYNDKITLSIKHEDSSVNYYIEKYYKEKFKININNQEVAFTFLGKQYEDDIMLSYLEIENVDKINSIQVISSMLFDVFPDQQNIVRFKIHSKNKSFLLTKNNNKSTLILP